MCHFSSLRLYRFCCFLVCCSNDSARFLAYNIPINLIQQLKSFRCLIKSQKCIPSDCTKRKNLRISMYVLVMTLLLLLIGVCFWIYGHNFILSRFVTEAKHKKKNIYGSSNYTLELSSFDISCCSPHTLLLFSKLNL